jgi:hypothetical protein
MQLYYREDILVSRNYRINNKKILSTPARSQCNQVINPIALLLNQAMWHAIRQQTAGQHQSTVLPPPKPLNATKLTRSDVCPYLNRQKAISCLCAFRKCQQAVVLFSLLVFWSFFNTTTNPTYHWENCRKHLDLFACWCNLMLPIHLHSSLANHGHQVVCCIRLT